jgi:hypothetical protein
LQVHRKNRRVLRLMVDREACCLPVGKRRASGKVYRQQCS